MGKIATKEALLKEKNTKLKRENKRLKSELASLKGNNLYIHSCLNEEKNKNFVLQKALLSTSCFECLIKTNLDMGEKGQKTELKELYEEETSLWEDENE